MENKIDLIQILKPIHKLNNLKKPKWGKMTAQEMVEHLILAFRMSNGKMPVDIHSDSSRIPALKRFLMSDKPMPKHFQNPLTDRLPLLEFNSLENATEQLFMEVEDFYDYFRRNQKAALNNPVFGELRYEEWLHFHRKHIRHHLKQFGCI